eukprot:10454845-Heterocapsa_arctica.AAC.1
MEADFFVMQVATFGLMRTRPAWPRKPVPRRADGPALKSPPMMAGRASLAIASPMSARMPRLKASSPVPAL